MGGDGHDIIFGDADYTTTTYDWTNRAQLQAYAAADETAPGWNSGTALSPVSGSFDTGNGGNDLIYGGGGGDWILAGRGDDIVYGDAGMDSIGGGVGNDVLYGGDDNDSVRGEDGDDWLSGDAGNDFLAGGAGNDTLDGGAGADLMIGGAGDDIYLNVTGDDTINDTEGKNIIQMAMANSVGTGGLTVCTFGDQGQYSQLNITLDNAETLKIQDAFFGTDATIQFANGSQQDLETLVGTTLTTALNLQMGDNGGKLYGGAAADYLYGGSGNDILSGALGDDTLSGGAGNDVLDGGVGDDIYIVKGSGTTHIQDHEGVNSLQIDSAAVAGDYKLFTDSQTDKVFIVKPDGSSIVIEQALFGTELAIKSTDSKLDIVSLREWINANLNTSVNLTVQTDNGNVYGGASSDRLAGLAGNNTLWGGAGEDTLNGNGGNDILYGDAGNDTLLGGEGNDTLSGGTGDDIMEGGLGADTYVFAKTSGHDVIPWQVDAQNDSILFEAGIQRSDLNLIRKINGDLVVAIKGADTDLTLSSWFSGPGQITQFQFADGSKVSQDDLEALKHPQILGTSAADDLKGTDFDDVILGYAGNDTLNGGGGNDILQGGAGRDSYLLQLGGSNVSNGLDTVIETSGEASVIKLINADFGDLVSQRSGDDLTLSILGSDEGLLLNDYYTHTSDWLIVDYSGTEQSLADVLSNNESRRADMDNMALLGEKFAAEWRSRLIKNGTGLTGATQLTDGQFELKPVINFDYHQTQMTDVSGAIINSYEYGTLYNEPWIVTSLNRQTVNNDEAEIYLDDGDAVQYSYSSKLAGVTLANWQQMNTSNTNEQRSYGHYEYRSQLITLPPDLNGFNASGYTVSPTNVPGQYLLTSYKYVAGNLMGYLQDTHIRGWAQVSSMIPGVGAPIEAIDLGHAALNHQSLPQSLTLNIDQFEQTFTLTTLNAGDADNNIHVSSIPGLSYIIHAGGGNDVIDFMEGSFEGRSFLGNSLDIVHPGVLMDGGAGNDTLLTNASFSNDILFGGTGRNYLKGSGGADRYILSTVGGLDLIDPSIQNNVQSVDTVELPDGITRDMLTTAFGQAIVQGQVQSTLNLSWSGKDHTLIVLPGADDWHGVNNFDHVAIKFADGTSVALEELIAVTPITDNIAYYKGNVRVAVATSSCSLTGQGVDNVFVVQGSGITNVKTGDGRNLLQGFNAQSQINAMLTPGSETWLGYGFYFNGGSTVADIKISGASTAQFHIQIGQSDLEHSVLRRDGQDLILQNQSNDLNYPWSRDLHFTDWFTETSQPQVEFGTWFIDQNINNYKYGQFSLHSLIDQFTAQNGGAVSDGSTVAIGSLNWRAAEVPITWGDYSPLGTSDDMTWQLPLTRVMFTAGMGSVIAEKYDVVAFNNSIASTDVYYTKSGNDLLVTLASGTDSLCLQDWYLRSDEPEAWFAKGEVWTYSDLSNQGITLTGTDGNDSLIAVDNYGWNLRGLTGNDVLQGNTGADILEGDEGDDTLTGGAGNDYLDGGAGNDMLSGGAGNDCYHFGLGFGTDSITDQTIIDSGDINTVAIGAGVLPENIIVNSDKNHIILSIAGTTDKLSIQWDTQNGYFVQQVQFDEGTVWTAAMLEAMAIPLNTAPKLVNPILNQNGVENHLFSFQIPAGTFHDTDSGDVLNYTAILADGSPLPTWLNFDAATRNFVGTPGLTDAGTFSLIVTVIDQGGLTANSTFNLNIANFIEGTVYNDSIAGSSGNDFISTGAGNDTVNAGDGNDVIIGGMGSDLLAGGAGDDIFRIEGNDSGYDRFQGDAGIDIILGGAGDDVIRVNNFSGIYTVEKIDGGLGNNILSGTQYNDTIDLTGTELVNIASIDGGVGNDTLIGSAGNDVIIGGSGSDLLAGGSGDDIFRIEGNDSGYDRFQGDAGIDIILGGAGDDVIRVNNYIGIYTVEKIDGGLGNNILSGTQYNDTIDLSGTELVNIASIDGGLGNDTLIGSAGNDVIIGGTGSDLLAGGAGDDIFRIEGNDSGYDCFQGDAGIDLILGGAGDDVIRVNNFSGAYMVEKIDGGLGNNILSGTQYNDTIDLSGTELVNIASIDGGLGNDTLIGSAGNDIIIGGTGSDLLAGGAGDDIFKIEGNDSGYDRFQGDAGIDIILGGAGDDVIRVNNFSGAYTVEKIDGGIGNNILAGTQYNDTIDLSGTELVNIASIEGGAGNDTLIGSAGNDVIIGGTGSDLLAGGAGDDIFQIIGSDSGYDRFQGDAGIDIILGGAGDDVIRVNNFSGAYTVEKIDGGLGNNILAGTQYNDTIDLSGTELVNIASIEGGAGNDKLIGSYSSDTLDGGAGNDTLIGGKGNDTYRFGTGSGADLIQEIDSTVGNTDVLAIATGIDSSQLWFRHIGNDLEMSLIGTGNKTTIKDWYLSTANHIEQFKTTDGDKTLIDSNVQNLVNAMASFAPPAAGQSILPQNYQTVLAPVIAANWQ
jgi:Ca2+-binding RTX toxin-like protein